MRQGADTGVRAAVVKKEEASEEADITSATTSAPEPLSPGKPKWKSDEDIGHENAQVAVAKPEADEDVNRKRNRESDDDLASPSSRPRFSSGSSASMPTRVVNVKVQFLRTGASGKGGRRYDSLKEWCDDPQNVYIGRGGVILFDVEGNGKKRRYPYKNSVLHNPFKVGPGKNRDKVCDLYRDYLLEKLEAEGEDGVFHRALADAKGKALGCWCKPERCHGDEIVKIMMTL
ncbi:hypothetical protein HK101_006100 [Irineochytrium annulatum]|nr:hypothetical protein HK101_006100 [Irineochytrium annulatum]